MSLYGIYRPSLSSTQTYPMEQFKNVNIAQNLLRRRAALRKSRTCYLGDTTPWQHRPEAEYPTADLTGYLAVWRRRAEQDPPAEGERPQERWTLTERGAVQTGPWDTPDGTDPAETLARTEPSFNHVESVTLMKILLNSGHPDTAELARILVTAADGPTYTALREQIIKARISLHPR